MQIKVAESKHYITKGKQGELVTTSWVPLQGATLTSFEDNASDPAIPEFFPVDAANILIKNGATVGLVDEKNLENTMSPKYNEIPNLYPQNFKANM